MLDKLELQNKIIKIVGSKILSPTEILKKIKQNHKVFDYLVRREILNLLEQEILDLHLTIGKVSVNKKFKLRHFK